MSEETDLSELEGTLDAPALLGTVRLAESALRSPTPPAQAEAESLRLVETLMQEAVLSPKILREAVAGHPRRPLLARLLFWRH